MKITTDKIIKTAIFTLSLDLDELQSILRAIHLSERVTQNTAEGPLKIVKDTISGELEKVTRAPITL